MTERRKRIGDILLQAGLINKDQLDKALEAQKKGSRSNIGSLLISMGFVSEKEKLSFFSSADVYVNTAFFEPFGLVYYEAAAAGVAMIASSKSGATDIFRHKKEALVVDPHSVESIASSMLEMFDPLLRDTLSSEAAKALKRISNLDLMSKQFSLYQRLLKGQPVKGRRVV